MGIFHSDADLFDEREENQGSDGVGNECGYDEDHGGEGYQHAVEAEMVDLFCD